MRPSSVQQKIQQPVQRAPSQTSKPVKGGHVPVNNTQTTPFKVNMVQQPIPRKPTTPSFWDYFFGVDTTTTAPFYVNPTFAPARYYMNDCDCFRDLETCPRGYHYGGECRHGDGIQCCEG